MKAESNALKSRTSSWPRIHTQTLPSGQPSFVIDVQLAGSRIFRRFTTTKDAEREAAKLRAQRDREGNSAFELPLRIRVEAAKCVEMLAEYPDATLTDATAHYVTHVLAYRNAPTVAEVVEKMLADAIKNNRRFHTIKELRLRLGKFAETFGARKVSEITIEELREWFDGLQLAPRTRINFATKVSQLFNYAVTNKWASENLVDRIANPSTDDKSVDFYTPDEAKVLLHHAADTGVLPFVAIGLFAGLRTNEITRLDWRAVKLAERCIIVGSDVAKKRSRRVVEINDTLTAWLALCARRTGRVCDLREDQLMSRIRQLVKAAGVTWKKNGLRHSFASYHLALHNDAVKTSFQMGNSPVIVHNHYKGLVGNGEVAKFWALRPATDVAEKIVPMAAQA